MRMTIFKRGFMALPVLALAGATLALSGCEFLDPTNVENPATTTDDLAQARNPTASLLPGLRAQFAQAINPVIPEVMSDNYSIHGTGINKTNDFPSQMTPDLIGGVYSTVQELRALAEFVLDDIVPVDTTAQPEHVQEATYYLGMAFLLLGERFAAAPVESDGVPVGSTALIQTAVTHLNAALGIASGGDFALATRAALARAYRLLGDAANAESNANVVLSDAMFISTQAYDPATITNGPYTFLVLRSLQEMQPLPRLDFLDPKYTAREAPITVAKAEEMLLILAEIQFSRGDYAGGREFLARAIETALARPRVNFSDDDPRLNEDLSPRPHHNTIQVRSDPNSAYRPGLVLSRPGTVPTPTIAYTSLDADSIRALNATTQTEDILHAFHLARQEMLFLEGRRMTDLGIRLPIELDEIETNPNINEGDPATVVVVPAYLPPEDAMDLFTPASPYNPDGSLATTQVTINVDVNRILAQQRISPFGQLP